MMDNQEVLKSLKTEVINHLENNFSLLLEEEAKVKVDYTTNEDIRRLSYYFNIYTDLGWKTVTYDFRISIEEGR